MPDPINNAEDAVHNTGVQRTQLTADDIMQLLTNSIKNGEPFATAFNSRVIIPLTQKINQKLYVSEIKLDGDSVGSHITETLQNETTEAAKAAGNKIAQSLKEISNKSELFETSEDGITLSDLFGGLDNETELQTAKKWNDIQLSIIDKAKKSIPDNFDFDDPSLDLFFGNVDSGSNDIDNQWNSLQQDIIAKAETQASNLDGTSIKALEDVEISSPPYVKNKIDDTIPLLDMSSQSIPPIKNDISDAGPATGEFKRLTSDVPEVDIRELKPKAMSQFAETFDFIQDFSFEQLKPPSWLSKLAGLGATLLAAGAIAAAYGLLTTGPLKGTAKVVSLTAFKAGSLVMKAVKQFAKVWLDDTVKSIQKVLPNSMKGLTDDVVEYALKIVKAPGKFITKKIPEYAAKLSQQIAGIIPGFLKGFGDDIAKLFIATKGGVLKKFGGGLLSKMGTSLALKFGKSALRKVPVLGLLLSLGFAYTRFKSGDIVGGIIDLASGVASTFPGVGTAISIGLDILNAVIDYKAGGSDAAAGNRKLNALSDFLEPIGAYILEKFNKTPLGLMAEGFGKLLGGDVKGGLTVLKTALWKLTPLGMIGGVFEWITGEDKVATATATANSKTIDIGKTIGSYISDKFKNSALWALGESIGMLVAGDIKGGLKQFGSSLFKLGPLGAIGDLIEWIVGEDELGDAMSAGTGTVISFAAIVRNSLKEKVQNLFNNAPKWMRWVMSKVPGMSSILDEELDEDYSDLGSDGSYSPTNEQASSSMSIAPMQNDFIWRSGGEVQPFNVNDNMLSVKDDNQFDRIVDALNGTSAKNEPNNNTIIEAHLQAITQAVKELINVVASTAGSGGAPAPTAAPQPEIGEIRDPAYALRSRVWSKMRTEY